MGIICRLLFLLIHDHNYYKHDTFDVNDYCIGMVIGHIWVGSNQTRTQIHYFFLVSYKDSDMSGLMGLGSQTSTKRVLMYLLKYT